MARNSKIQQLAEDLWRPSGFTAPTSEIIARMADQGFKVTDTLLRAWKSRKGWKTERRMTLEGKVRAARDRPKQGGNKGSKKAEAVERAATELAVVTNAMAEEAEDAEIIPGEYLTNMERTGRSMVRMIGSSARKFSSAMGELKIKTAEDALALARAVSLLADSGTRIATALRDARHGTPNLRQFKQETSPVTIQNIVAPQAAPAPEPEPVMKDITPEPPKRLSRVLDSFRTN